MIRLGGWLGCLLILLCGASTLAAQAPASKERAPERPTTVTADHLEVNRKERKAIYTGNVVARTTDLTVTADRMEFGFDEKMEAVELMVALGNVHIRRRDGTMAVSERAIYYVSQEKVVLEGRPRAWRQGNMVTGTRMTLYIKEDRQVVEGDRSERVTAVIYPKRPPGQAR
ncbi:MAG: lipopolysaccharide transport periplasmic protein LptA [Candidatus Methylomirabilales bacterium]